MIQTFLLQPFTAAISDARLSGYWYASVDFFTHFDKIKITHIFLYHVCDFSRCDDEYSKDSNRHH